MAHLTLLGTGSAWSGPGRENTYMVVEGRKHLILVDCGGGPAQRLAMVGVDIATVDSVILTHTDPDHIYGWPIFALNAWMANGVQPLHVYGLPETLRAARMMMRAVRSEKWPGFLPPRYHRVEPVGSSLIIANHDFSVSATLADHFVPTLALRFTSAETGVSIAYSCDTAPSERVAELAQGVKYFFHEATTLDTSSPCHSSAAQAGAQALRANAQTLVLVHLPRDVRPTLWRTAARREFKGLIVVARDLQSFNF
jgi:ribonuclease BN (tRNA processing enzyme)